MMSRILFSVLCLLSSVFADLSVSSDVGDCQAIPERYHTYDEVVSELDSIAQTYPDITRLNIIGTTDSLTIWALKISDNPLIEEDEPALLYNGIHHAEELLGAEICMYMINDLVNRYGVDSVVTRWVNDLEIWVVPIINPDGHNVVTSCIDTTWRKNTRDNNNNGFFDTDSDGVDLNRNYDFNWTGPGASSDPTSEYYRGPSPFSELETQAIRNLSLAQHFVFDVCYHSARTGTKEVIYYPWRWDINFSPDHPTIKPIADSMAKLIVNEMGTGTYAAIWGEVEQGGSARNWFYGAMGTFSFTVEVCTTCIPPGETVDPLCQRNLQGAYFLLDRVQGSSITGHITDSATGTPLIAEVKILEAYDSILPPRLSEPQFGRYRRILAPGVYTVEVSKHGYATVTITNVVVDTGAPTILDIQLPYIGVEERFFVPMKIGTQNDRLEIYPNPFTHKTEIRIHPHFLRGDCLKIYDLAGRLLQTLPITSSNFLSPTSRGNSQLPVTSIVWDGTDAAHQKLPSGIYFIHLQGATTTSGRVRRDPPLTVKAFLIK